MYILVMSDICSALGAVTGIPSVDDEDGDAMGGGGGGGRPEVVGNDEKETGGVDEVAALEEALEEGGDATPLDGGPPC